MSELAAIPNTLLSWSTERSKAAATALRGWLPRMIQRCAPWMSAEDVHAGKRWRRETAQALNTVKVGVVCATRDNLDRRWLNYEAGALSVRLPQEERVIVYCLDLSPADCGDPLSDFQGVTADEAGTLKLVRSINAAMDEQIKDTDLEELFKVMWPGLKAELDKIPPSSTKAPPQRPDREVLDEILARVKGIERDDGNAAGPIDRLFRFSPPDAATLAAMLKQRQESEAFTAAIIDSIGPPEELARRRQEAQRIIVEATERARAAAALSPTPPSGKPPA
jgi:hypothetical protein